MINHEVWRLVASGLLTALIAELRAVTNRDSRARLIDQEAFIGGFFTTCYNSLGYVPGRGAVQAVWSEIADPVYDPRLREQEIPPPANAKGGAALAADAPAEGHTVVVFAWDYSTFTEVGDLAEASKPEPGVYVLATRRDGDGRLSLPSAFLTLE